MIEDVDDMMKGRLDNHESEVPQDLFNSIRSKMDAMDDRFDAAIHGVLANYESAIPNDMFDSIANQMEADAAVFDSIITTKLEALSSPVPDDMWQRILQQKDKRRPLAWWWAAAFICVLAGGVGTYYYWQHTSLLVASHSETPKNGNSPNNNYTTLSNQQYTALKNEVAANIAGLSTVVNPIVSADSYAPTSTDNQHHNKDNKRQAVAHTIWVNNTPALSNRYGANKPSNQIALLRNEGPSTLDETEMTQTSNEAFELMVEATSLLSFRQKIYASLNKLSPLQLLKASNPILPCPINQDSPRNDWYADIYVSPYLAFNNTTPKVSGKNVQSGLDSTLHKQASFNAGISLVKNIGQNFLVKAGLQYNQVNELFRNTQVNEIKLITTVTVRTVILSPGDTIYIRDTSVLQQVGTITRQTQNHYKSWDIPLIIGYEFGGEDLKLNANLGLIANIRSSYTGNLLDTTQQIIDLANYSNKGIYKTNVGLGLYAGVSIIKSLGGRTNLLIEPFGRIHLSNTTTDAAWFNQKKIVTGISIGLRYKLNGQRQR